MDITKLITLGRIEKELVIDGIKFIFSTPVHGDTVAHKDTDGPVDFLCDAIIQIDDRKYDNNNRAELLDILSKVQNMIIVKLMTFHSDLITEQKEFIDQLASKKA